MVALRPAITAPQNTTNISSHPPDSKEDFPAEEQSGEGREEGGREEGGSTKTWQIATPPGDAWYCLTLPLARWCSIAALGSAVARKSLPSFPQHVNAAAQQPAVKNTATLAVAVTHDSLRDVYQAKAVDYRVWGRARPAHCATAAQRN